MSEASEQAADIRALGEAIQQTSAALDRMRGGASNAANAVNRFGDRLGNFRGTVRDAVGAVMEFAQALGDATAAEAKQVRALSLLGGAYDAVAQQTNGVISAQEALTARGTLTNTGLQVTAEQLALMSRAAREYALATGGEATQALEQMTDALGEASEDGLRRFNLQVQQGVPRQQQFNAALQQLQERFRGTAPAALAADERVGVFTRTLTETKNLVLGSLAQGLEAFGSTLTRVGGSSDSFTENLRQLNTELRDAGSTGFLQLLFGRGVAGPSNVEVQAARAREQMAAIEATNRRFVVERTAFENSESMRAAGFRLDATRNLNNEQKRLLVQLFDESDRLSAQEFVRRANEIQRLQEMRRAAAQQTAELARLQAVMDNQAFLDRAAHARDDLGMAIRAAQQAGQRNYLTQQAVTPMQRLAFLQRELGRLSQDETTNRAQILSSLQEITQLRQQQRQEAQQAAQEARQRAQDAQRLIDAEQELRNVRATAAGEGAEMALPERRRFETALEFTQRQIEHARRALEVNRTMRREENEHHNRYLEERRAQIAADREQAVAKEAARRAQIEGAAAAVREDEFANRLRQSFGLANAEIQTTNQMLATSAKTGADAIGELVKGSISAAASAASAGADAGAAIAKYVDEWTASKALQWGLQALEAIAGAGVAYFIRPDAVAGLLASAATYAGLAATAGAVTAAIPNAPAAGTGGGQAGVGGAERMAGSSRTETASERAAVAPIVFNVSGFTSTESAQEGIVRALREAQSRGLIEMGR
jgi:hypothetical protein